MSRAEKFIQDCTRNCSNLVYKDTINRKEFNTYNEWITPDQARKAVEIAREETLQEVKEELLMMLNTSIDNKHFFEQLDDYIEELETKQRKMSKAEERALEAYPSTSHYWNAEPDRNAEAREFYKQGYRQAEKDLELTWKDMRELYIIFAEIDVEIELCKTDVKAETLGYYQEVLKRFKERKENGTK